MTFVRYLLLCSLLLSLMAVPVLAEDVAIDGETLQFADGLYVRKMYDLAVKEYQSFIKNYPKSDKLDVAYFRLGECYRKKGDDFKAIDAYLIVFKDYPKSSFSHIAGYRRAKIIFDTEKYEVSIYWFDRLLEKKPNPEISSASLYFQSESYLKTDKKEKAEAGFKKITSTYKSSEFYSLALLKLGELYGSSFDKSLEVYEAAIKDPASDRIEAEALFQKAELCFRNKEFKKSAETYRSLLAKFPSDIRSGEAVLQAAWSAHNAGLYAEALLIADNNITEGSLPADDPGSNGEWLYLKANCERQLKKNKAAINSYSTLLKDYSKGSFSDAARYEKALMLYKIGDYREAIKAASEIKLDDDIKIDLYWLLAESHSELKEDDSAVQYYRLIIDEAPDNRLACDAAYRLAHGLQAKEDYKEASRYYNIVAKNFPSNTLAPKALFASAFCLNKIGDDAEAVRDWTELVRKYSADPLAEESLYQKAVAETRMRRDDEAMASFKEFIQKYPSSRFSVNARYWRGLLYRDSGLLKNAEEEFRFVLNKEPDGKLGKETAFQLALILQKLGNEEESAVLLQSLVLSDEHGKFSPSLLQWLAEFQYTKGKFKESESAAKLLTDVKLDPSLQETGWCFVGKALLGQENRKSAKDAFGKALKIKAGTAYAGESALQLGQIMLDEKDYDGAEKYFMTASKLAVHDKGMRVRAYSHLGLGHAAKGKSDYELAAKYFMSVAILYEDAELVPECLYEAGSAFEETGKNDEALKAFQELVARYPESRFAKRTLKDE